MNATFALDGLAKAGFGGFVQARPTLMDRGALVPEYPATYAVVRDSSTPPTFIAISPAGHFKGKDPTVPIGVLRAAWVPDARVVYIGKADQLRRRIVQLLDFGAGRPIGHWGGRYIWQLADSDSLIVAWRRETDPREAEIDLLRRFRDEFGSLPFGNLAG